MKTNYKTKFSKEMEAFFKEQKDNSFFASDVLSYMQERDVPVNQATIYRNLDKYVEKKELVKFMAPNCSGHMYRLCLREHGCHEHLHLRCGKCGKILHFEDDVMHDIAHHLKEAYGFSLNCDESFLSGLCSDCQKEV